MFSRIQKAKEENEGGFTLIELLVVVVIIGILAAIAIPTFLNQRQKAWEKAALSDLRNASVAAETYFSDFGTYPASQTVLTGTGDYGVKLSDGVTWVMADGNASNYCLEVTHSSLKEADDKFTLNSATGKATKGTTVCTAIP